ncbi:MULTISPECIES: Bug family tripartite tricarboxylate transporter substrate binding protein [unclassified Variovorax]|uniref:Bug family tripartite tricarboxylate transporter substrate binding protein n=1 Tax=unclassified Variovorax TaxID=663243 RepID=UPI000D11584C|nr:MULTISPECIES: tripartite tricarboxylate transporter substrate binding protein [unclassified Variovorax]AVQ85038.1 ABC transporter substrate-binding protein [Variovorax sp. PMC12]QRY34653.1 tripartite tricarboxylate transporter substrate binding protein [Variovorax sp. PDNC026]
MKTFLKAIAALGCALLLSAPGHAASEADGWPSRPLTFVVPFPPGGITDNTSRLLAQKLGEKLGQPVVVENRPGAGGSIGVDSAARQPADGYTLIYGTQGTHAANLALYKNVRYDPVKDFTAVHGMSESPLILVINPNKPFKTVPELVEYAKKNPGKLNFGSAGAGTATHLTAELFQTTAGIRMTHVPYKGSSPALTDLIAGNLDLAFDYAAVVLPFVQSGKLKALAVTGKSRLSSAPDLPTVGELGYPGAASSAWGAMFVSSKTPAPIVKRLADAMAEAIVNPELLAATEKFGSVPMRGMRGEKLDAFVKSEMTRWRDVVQSSGAKLE